MVCFRKNSLSQQMRRVSNYRGRGSDIGIFGIIPDSVRGVLTESVSVDMSSRSPARKVLKSGVREAVEDSNYVTKEEVREMVKEAGESYSVDELREQLPEEIFEAVMERIDLDDSPPETMEEVGKSAVLAKELYVDAPSEDSDAPLEKGAIGGEFEQAGTVGAAHHLTGESPFEEVDVEVSKTTEHRLDRFYGDVEE